MKPFSRFLMALWAIPCSPLAGGAEQVVFEDHFTAYPEGTVPDSTWEIASGEFVVHQGRLVSGGTGNAVAYAYLAPDLTEQVLEVTITPLRRTTVGGWAAAGLTLFQDGGNYWRLALVESPGQERYAELVEMYEGLWQAQNQPGTGLKVQPDGLAGFAWEAGRPYRFRLTLTRSGILGEIFDAPGLGEATAPLRFRRGFEWPEEASAVRSGRVALNAVDLEAGFQDVRVTSSQPLTTWHREPDQPYRIAVHGSSGSDRTLRAALTAQGWEAVELPDASLGDPAGLNPGRFDALLLPDGARCPIRAKGNLLQFLRGGGDLLVIGGPLFEATVGEAEAEWSRTLQAVPRHRSLIDFGTAEVTAWQRASNNPQSRTTWTVETAELPGEGNPTPALRVEVENLTSWDTLSAPVSEAFPPGDELTLFWAKGAEQTTALLFEWQERDGSRWIATVPLTPQWKRYVLAPEDFRYWPDNPSVGRGGTGDRLNPQQVVRLSVGLAQSHANLPSGQHLFWIAAIGAGRLPEKIHQPDLSLPVLEMFSPFYKYYRLPSLRPRTSELRQAAATGHQTGPVVTPIPRPRGLGFAGSRRGRWIPLAEIRDDRGRWRGTRESLFVNLGVPYRGSVWGHLAGVEERSDLARAVVRMVRRMSTGVFLAKAGAEHFSYFTDESIPLGAQVANFSPRERKVNLELQVVKVTRIGAAPRNRPRRLFHFSATVTLSPGQARSVQRSWRPSRPEAGIYQVVTELKEGGKPIDRIVQEFTLLETPKAPQADFVCVKEGDFYAPPLGARRGPSAPTKWYPYGVNYWQSNVAGTDTSEYWLHWLAPSFYDPEVVERDLATLEALGFTAVSIQLGNPDHVRQVNDFVFRAARHGIRTNLFIGGAHPFYTDEPLFTRLITAGRFAGNPHIWAYDIAWEHHLGGHNERRNWDREWEEWVIERYGTLEHAEQNWGFPIPRDENGRVTNPSDEQLRTDGPWLKMAAAYERCADDVISRRYREVIRKIRALDPNHLISARSASQPSWTGWFAYDLLSCGKHFDFSSPEGYGLQPEEAGFTTAYARYAGHGKPVFWAEFGASIFPYDRTGERSQIQARLHRGFAQMLLDSGANGLASWWSVGGYRVDERSDFGIIAPDGTPREAARELQRRAREITSPRSTRPPSVWVTIDRDLHAAAYQAVYETHKHAYVEAVKEGKMVGVRTAGTGTTSADCPLLAVGNVPYDGFNPLKFLNAEFNWIRLRNVRGEWQEVRSGDTVEVAAGQPLEAQVSVGNLGEATWLAQGHPGAVRLIGDDRRDAFSSERPRLSFALPLPREVSRYEDLEFPPFVVAPRLEQDCEVVFTLEAEGRARFGERRRVLIRVISEE
jgi:hypothetical protein